MKAQLISLALLTMCTMISPYAHGSGGGGCINPLNPLVDPIVGTWSGSVTIGSTSYPANVVYNAGGTGASGGVLSIGATFLPGGQNFSFESVIWKKTGNKTYKTVSPFIANVPSTGGTFPTIPYKRVLVSGNVTMANDCQSISINAQVAQYELSDAGYTSPNAGTIVPFTENYVRINIQ